MTASSSLLYINKLIRFYKGANGLKTGSTDKALCCLSGSAMRDNLQLICVVMAAPTSPQRFADASKMLDYGFANYAIKRIVTKDESLGDAPVVNGMAQTMPAAAKTTTTRSRLRGIIPTLSVNWSSTIHYRTNQDWR